MEKVNSNNLFLNGQSVLFEEPIIFNNQGKFRNDTILQQALNNVAPISKCSNLQDVFLVENPKNDEKNNLVALSLQDAADLSLQIENKTPMNELNQFLNLNENKFSYNIQTNIIDGKVTYQLQIPEIPEQEIVNIESFPNQDAQNQAQIETESIKNDELFLPVNFHAMINSIPNTVNIKNSQPINNGIFVINQPSSNIVLSKNVIKNIVDIKKIIPSKNDEIKKTPVVKNAQLFTLPEVKLVDPKVNNSKIKITNKNGLTKIITVKNQGKDKFISLADDKIPIITSGNNIRVSGPVKKIPNIKIVNPSESLNKKTKKTVKISKPPIVEVTKESQVNKPDVMNPSSLKALAEKIIPIAKNPVGKLTQSQIKRIAAVLEQNKSSSSALVDNGDNSKILCRILYPEDFKPGSEKKILMKLDRKLKTKQKHANEKKEETIKKIEIIKTRRTRSGRVSKPSVHVTVPDDTLIIKEIENNENASEPTLLPGLETRTAYSSHFKCGTCNKLYLSKTSRARHLKQFPDHVMASDESIYSNSDAPKKKRVPLSTVENVKQVMKKYSKEEVIDATSDIMAENLSLWDFAFLRFKSLESKGQSVLNELDKFLQEVKKYWQNMSSEQANREFEHTSDEVRALLGYKSDVYENETDIRSQPLKRLLDSPEVEESSKRLKEDVLVQDIVSEPDKDLTYPLLGEMYLSQTEFDSVDQIVNERLRTLADGDDIIPPVLPPEGLESLEGLLKSVQPLTDSILFNPPTTSTTEDLIATFDLADLTNEYSNTIKL